MTAYSSNVAVISEKWTKRGGRIELNCGKSRDIFEFESSSEMVDQLRNARSLANRLLSQGKVTRIVEELQ